MIKFFDNRRSVMVLIVAAFWLVYLSVTIGTFIHESSNYYDDYLGEKKQLLKFHFSNAESFLLNNKPEALVERLNMAQGLQQFDFFILKDGQKVIATNLKELPDQIAPQFLQFGEITENDSLVVGSHKIYDYELMIGVSKSQSLFIKRQFSKRWLSIAKDIGVVTFLLFLIVFSILKDLIELSKILKSKNRKSTIDLKPISAESEAILRATRGFENTTKGLSDRNTSYGQAITSAILKELRQGQTPPYKVTYTMARIDMNDYTRLMLDTKPEELQSIMGQFFKLSRKVIEKYGGGIYQHVGDEIVFMFKAGEPDDSVRLCLRAIADIFSLSHQVKSKTFPEGAKFKASLVPGTVYFVQPDLIYAFSGHSLAETGRMLSQVEEKDQNTLVMYSKDALSVKDLGIIKREKSRQFKGFSSESSISEISDFIRVQKFFEARINELSRHKDHLGILPYLYRSSSDVLFILDLLKARFQERDFDSVFSLARGFVKSESSYWDEGNLEIEIKIAEILEIAVSQNLHLEIKSRALSTLVTIISLLVGPECRNETLFSAIEVLSRSRDHRVVANIIRTKERLGQDLGPYNILLNSDSNRVQADVAIALGRKNFDKEIYSTLKKAIKSKNPFFVASAIYAITNLALYYLEHDSVYLVSNPDFEDLLVKIPPLVEHENIMIQNRARISMSELLEAEVNRFLPAAFDGTLDSTNFKN